MSQIISLKKLYALRSTLSADDIVILATGVFDILHSEHFKLLKKAKRLGNILLVGLESDSRVQKIKGQGRPKNSLNLRLKNLQTLQLADQIFALPDLSTAAAREKLILALRPNILAVSSSTPHLVEKHRLMKLVQGQVKIILIHNPQISTSKLIQNHQYICQVIQGKGRGKKLGLPTFNLKIPPHFSLRPGIYACWIWLKKRQYPAVLHYGPVPVFGQKTKSLEIHVLGYHSSQPIENLTFRPVKFLRPVKNFPSPSALTAQIYHDIKITSKLLNFYCIPSK